MTWKLVIIILMLFAASAYTGDAAYPDSVITTVATGNSPRNVCCHPSGEHLYVAVGFGYVTVISTSDYSIEAFIPVSESPADLCVLPTGDRVYVCDENDTAVRIIDTASNVVTGEITVPYSASRIISMPDGSEVVVMHCEGHVSVIDTSDNTLQGTWWAAYSPSGICVLPGGTHLYVSDQSSANATCFTLPGFSLSRFFVGADTYDVCTLPAGNRVYLSERDWSTIAVMSAPDNTLLTEVTDVGVSPNRLIALPSGDYVYVSDNEDNRVRVIRTSDNTIVAGIAVGFEPTGMCSSPDGSIVAVVNTAGNNMTVLGRSTSGTGGGLTPPADLTLSVMPNPAAGISLLTVSLPSEGHVICSIYGMDGRMEGILHDGALSAGQHELPLCDLGPGIHLIVVESGSVRRIARLVNLD